MLNVNTITNCWGATNVQDYWKDQCRDFEIRNTFPFFLVGMCKRIELPRGLVTCSQSSGEHEVRKREMNGAEGLPLQLQFDKDYLWYGVSVLSPHERLAVTETVYLDVLCQLAHYRKHFAPTKE
jgi:hypothetical protein